MPRVICVHEYVLKEEITGIEFEHAVHIAQQRRLFELPGMTSWSFLRGLRGEHQNAYAAIWIYDSLQSWEALWGSLDQPVPTAAYPKSWKIWEQEVLAPLLDRPPDEIDFTAYIEVQRGDN